MVDVTKECGAEVLTDTALDRVHRLRARGMMCERHMWRKGVWIPKPPLEPSWLSSYGSHLQTCQHIIQNYIDVSPWNCARGHHRWTRCRHSWPMGTVDTGLAMGTVLTGGVINHVRCSVGSYTVSSFMSKKEIASSPQ